MKPKENLMDAESSFSYGELFFSTTDGKGRIKYGNNVFTRVSKFAAEEVMGAPHNIIRHPDMPRCVFKLFWDTVKSGSPIIAYVKNKAKDGSFYWVLAMAFPIKDGYLSIRFKPSSPLLEKVKALYAEMLEAEKEHPIEKVELMLLGRLADLGFTNYRSFMIHAVMEELRSYDLQMKLIKTETNDTVRDTLGEISSITLTTLEKFNNNFEMIQQFSGSNKAIAGIIQDLRDKFNNLSFLSINMKVMAARYGEKAVTLGVVSHEFSELAAKIENQLSSFSDFVNELASTINESSFDLACLKSQVMMVDFFVKESVQEFTTNKNAFSGMIENQDAFTSLYNDSNIKLQNQLKELNKKIIEMTANLKDIQKFISGLEVIRQCGAIESSRDDEVKSSFIFYISEMDNFTALLRESVAAFNENKDVLYDNCKDISSSTTSVSSNITRLFDLALDIQRSGKNNEIIDLSGEPSNLGA